MTKEQHIEYANTITELQKNAGEAVKSAAFEHLNKVLQLSRGNMQAFKMITEKTQKQFMKSVLTVLIKEQQKARAIGKKYSNA